MIYQYKMQLELDRQAMVALLIALGPVIAFGLQGKALSRISDKMWNVIVAKNIDYGASRR